MAFERRGLFNGNKGETWINGIKMISASKAESKLKIEYEEFPDPNGNGKMRVPVGEDIEISLTYKVTEETDAHALNLFETSEDIDVIISNMSINGKSTKRVKLTDVTFDELPLVIYERNKVNEYTYSGKARKYDWLQK